MAATPRGQAPSELQGVATIFLLGAVRMFERNGKLLATEMVSDVGPFASSIDSFVTISQAGLASFNACLTAYDALIRGSGTDTADKELPGLQDLQGRLQEDILKPLAGARGRDEADAALAIDRAYGKLRAILQQARNERLILERSLEQIASKPVERVVVAFDLAKYGRKAVIVNDELGPTAVARLNEWVKNAMEAGVRAARKSVDDVLIVTQGDGGILVFDKAHGAFRFAEALHRYAQKHNSTMTRAEARRFFRVGISIGVIVHERRTRGGQFIGFNIAGVPIIEAVRLEAACPLEGILATDAVWNRLPKAVQERFGRKRQVKGKHPHERFSARTCKIVASSINSAKKKTRKRKATPKKPVRKKGSVGKPKAPSRKGKTPAAKKSKRKKIQ